MSAHIRRSSASRLMKRPEVSAFKKSTQVGGSDLFATSMINGSSIVYVEQMFGQWKKDPESVHPSWNAYFRNLENGYSPANSYTAPPTLGNQSPITNRHASDSPTLGALAHCSACHGPFSSQCCAGCQGRHRPRASGYRGRENFANAEVVSGIWPRGGHH